MRNNLKYLSRYGNNVCFLSLSQIVQLAAYTPKDHFEQYIMPYMNLNPAARQRHQVRVISIGFYRMLKSMQTYKVRQLNI